MWFHLVSVHSIQRLLKQRKLRIAIMLALGWGLSVAIAACTPSSTPNATAVSSPIAVSPSPANLSDVTLRVAKYKGGWDLQIKLAGLDDFPYKTEFKEFAGGNIMLQAINAGAIDLASASETPPIFAINSKAAVKIIAATKGPTVNQAVLVPKDSTAQTIADLKGKKVGYIKATTAHYFLIRMLQQVGLTMKDIKAVPISIPDGLTAFAKGDLDAWATYGYSIQQSQRLGGRVLQSAKDILSGNFMITAAPSAIADSGKKAAIADFLCRVKKSEVWRASNLETWAKSYAKAVGTDESIVLDVAKQELAQRRFELLPTSNEAIASQQKVADTFSDAGVISSKVDVKPLWDNTFNDAVTKCSL